MSGRCFRSTAWALDDWSILAAVTLMSAATRLRGTRFQLGALYE